MHRAQAVSPRSSARTSFGSPGTVSRASAQADRGRLRDQRVLPDATGCSRADVEDGIKPGTTAAENAELREAKKRIRLLEQENEVLRRAAAYLSQANLPGK